MQSGTATRAAPSASAPVRVMVVDDSAVVRGLITRMLEADPTITVVSSVGNGEMALKALERNDIEVAVLDIEMPVMDGITALPKLLAAQKDLQVIMASTLTAKNADISLRCLQMGAAEYVPKPSSSREISGGLDFKRELTDKVKALGGAARQGKTAMPRPKTSQATTGQATTGHSRPAPATGGQKPTAAPAPGAPIVLRQTAPNRPDVIAIGSSTGGPQALFAVLKTLKPAGVKQPVLITQHMPATFTKILADHIARVSSLPTTEASDGAVIEPGHIYIAPGDYHMQVETKGVNKVLRINQNPPENFCRPAVDPMFRSISAAYGKNVLALVLTGMGADGAKGGKIIADAGGTVIAQDEATSVVWGMPGAAATSGICSAVLPIDDIGPYLAKIANKRA